MTDADRDDELWEAVADPTRKKVLDLLVARGEATATALTRHVPVTRQAITKHLNVLERAGLVQGRREGREVRFAVREQQLANASRTLAEAADRWDRRLQRIKDLAEDSHAADQRD